MSTGVLTSPCFTYRDTEARDRRHCAQGGTTRMRTSSPTFQACGLTRGHYVPYKYMSSTQQFAQHFGTHISGSSPCPRRRQSRDSHLHLPNEEAAAQRSFQVGAGRVAHLERAWEPLPFPIPGASSSSCSCVSFVINESRCFPEFVSPCSE